VRGKRVVASGQRLSAEKPQQHLVLVVQTVIGITHFQTGVSWHFHSRKDQVLKIELFDAQWQAGVISAILRLRVQWLSHLAPIMTESCLPRVPPFQGGEMAGKRYESYSKGTVNVE